MEEAAGGSRVEEFRAVFADQGSFRRWYEQAISVVYPFVFARCGADQSLAVEITQETFVEAVRGRASFDGSAEPVTWLCSIARHKIADHFRRVERERRRFVRLVHREGEREEDPSRAVEVRQAVVEALDALPSTQRAVLAMHYLDEMPVREIAAALDKSERAVESLLARAREGFKRRHEAGAADGR